METAWQWLNSFFNTDKMAELGFEPRSVCPFCHSTISRESLCHACFYVSVSFSLFSRKKCLYFLYCFQNPLIFEMILQSLGASMRDRLAPRLWFQQTLVCCSSISFTTVNVMKFHLYDISVERCFSPLQINCLLLCKLFLFFNNYITMCSILTTLLLNPL